MRIAIAACATNPELSASNRAFENALKSSGVDVTVLNWNGHTTAEFLACDLTVLRQTWDYKDDPGGFAAWLVRLHALGAKIEARPDLAIWNNDKRTLIDLKDAGVQIPLTFRSFEDALANRAESSMSEDVVLKPVFGGDGVGVELTTLSEIELALGSLQQSVPTRPIMVQEFLPQIGDGEWKMTCIEGRVELTVCAKPTEGEFRINSRFGPNVRVSEPPAAAKSAAEMIMRFVGNPLCGRVDGVMRDGAFVCTELELCDPDLHLHYAPEVATLLAEAVIQRLGREQL